MTTAFIELRSDTFTTPCPAMREAIARAEVGDDVWGEDPTVVRLERRVAGLLAKQEGLFVPSGTMANQIALAVHTHHGDEVLVGQGSHCYVYEGGAGAALSGVQFKLIGSGGVYVAADVEAALSPDDVHFARPSLVWLENTHNQGGGRVFRQADVEAVAELARRHGMAVHLDGARLLNAAVATGRSPGELAGPVDSSSICLSKGLGAPVGSVLVGDAAFIARARRIRKRLGGAMRQVGVLAAAGLYALEHNVERLAQDHELARLLARGLSQLPGVEVAPNGVETNIVMFDLDGTAPSALIRTCLQRGLRTSTSPQARTRRTSTPASRIPVPPRSATPCSSTPMATASRMPARAAWRMSP